MAEIVHEAKQHRAIVIEQRQGLPDQTQTQQERRIDETSVAQKKDPGIGSHKEAGPEGKDHQEQIESASFPRAGKEESQGKAEQKA